MTQEDEELRKYWKIYNKIRKISYILMDSNYAPIPFNLDLSSILLNMDEYQEDIINKYSNFQKGIEQMNNFLETSLYLEANSMLVSGFRSNQLYKK